MSPKEPQEKPPACDPNEHVDKCLSLVLHYDEVQRIAAIIKKVIAARRGDGSEKARGQACHT